MKTATSLILASSSYLILARFLGIAVKFVYVIVLARYLGAQDYGLYNYAQGLYLLFFPLSALGLWTVIYRDIGQSENKGRKTIAQTLGLRSALSLLAAFLCLVAGLAFASNSITQSLAFIFSFALLGRALATWVEHVATAFSKSTLVLKLESIFRPVEALCGIVILLCGGGVIGIALVHALVWWAQGLYGFRLVNWSLGPFKADYEWRGIKRLVKKGCVLGLGSFLIVWFMQGPVVMFKLTQGLNSELGQLSLLMQVFTILVIIPQMVVAAALPIISSKGMQKEKNELKLALLMMKISWVIFWVGGLLALEVAPWILPSVFGEQYEEAGNSASYFVFALIPWSWAMASWQVEVSRGRILIPTVWLFLGVSFFTILYLLLVPSISLAGVAIALISGVFVWALGLAFCLGRQVIYPISAMLLWSLMSGIVNVSVDSELLRWLFSTTVALLGAWMLLVRDNQKVAPSV